MHTAKKRLLAMLLTLAMVISLFPVTALADEGEEAGSIAPVEETTPAENLSPAEGSPGSIAPAGEEPAAQPEKPVADEIQESGSCGNNLTWDFSGKALTISGTGDMTNWSDYTSRAPWYEFAERIYSLHLKEGMTSIGSMAFRSLKVTEVVIPEGVTRIGAEAFESCLKLREISLPSSLTSIEKWVFFNCSELGTVELPEALTSIGQQAFVGCSGLQEIRFAGPAPSFGSNCFQGVSATAYYPAGDSSWTEEVRQSYGGELSWEVYSPAPAIVASGSCGDNANWTLYDSGELVINGQGETSKAASIYDSPWYSYSSQITSLTVRNGITSIFARAFDSCKQLQTIQLPSSLKKIDSYAFSFCSSLERIDLPVGLIEVGEHAFDGCNAVSSITLPEGLVSIGAYGFDACHGVTSLDFPESLTTVGNYAFSNCWGLTEVTVPETLVNIGHSIFNNCYALKTVHLPDTLPAIGDWWFSYTKLEDVQLPSRLQSIGYLAFNCCTELQRIDFPELLTSLGSKAFSGCTALKEIHFEGSAPSIGTDCFMNVTATAYYPAGDPSWTEEVRQSYGGTITWVAKVPEVVASGTCGENLTWVLDENGLLTISGEGEMDDYYCFEEDPDSAPVTVAGDPADRLPSGDVISEEAGPAPWDPYRSSIRQVILEAGVTSIGSDAFSYCSSLEILVLPQSLATVNRTAFYSVSSIRQALYAGSEARRARMSFGAGDGMQLLPDAVWHYGKTAADIVPLTVEVCAGLTVSAESIAVRGEKLPLEVTVDPGYSLLEIRANGTAIDPEAFIVSDESSISVSFVAEERYPGHGSVTASGTCGSQGDNLRWLLYEDGALIIFGTGEMGGWWDGEVPWDNYYSDIRSVRIHAPLTAIPPFAFQCPNLTDVELPDSVTSIKQSAFSGCSSLQTLKLPESLTSIYYYAFLGCGLTHIEIPASVTSIGLAAFGYCPGLLTAGPIGSGSNIEFGWTTGIPGGAFGWCDSLTAVKIPEGFTSIGGGAFSGCSSLTEITIPGSVISIGDEAFNSCSSLRDIRFEGDAPSIGSDVFSGVTATVYYPGANASWTEEIRQSYGGDLTWVAYGSCGAEGDNLTWTLYKSGTLIISGTGEMISCTDGSQYPWAQYRERISFLGVDEGVTSIGAYAFSIDSDHAYTKLSYIVLPSTLTEIGEGAFQHCSSVTYADMMEGLIEIGPSAFSGCTSLEDVTIPGSVTSIGSYAFARCGTLETVTFLGNAPSIAENAFDGNDVGEGNCVRAVALYPADKEGWSADTLRDYGARSLTWVPYRDVPRFYSVQYNANGGENAPEEQLKGHNADLILTGEVPARVGFRFLGWAAVASATEAEYAPGGVYSGNADITLYAVWESVYYTVRFDANGGVGAPEAMTKTHGQPLTLPNVEPSRADDAAPSFTVTLDPAGGTVETAVLEAPRTNHYSFASWNTQANGSGTSYAPGGSYTAEKDATLYAQWSVVTTTAPLSLPTPVREHYLFKGWATSSSASGGVTGSYTPGGNVTLYAVWELERYTVRFDANGGVGAPEAMTKTHGQPLTLPNVEPSRADDAAPSFTVTLDPAGGTVETAVLEAPRTNHYSFASWNTAPEGSGTSYAPGGSYTAEKDATLYAQWSVVTTTAPVSLPTPVRSNYVFKGWATSSTASGGITGSYTPDSNVTLYAVWEPEHYTISFDANGGEDAPEAVTKTYGEPLTLPEAQPTRADDAAPSFTVTLDPAGGTLEATSLEALRTNHYSFQSWNTQANGYGISYAPGGSYTAEEGATLYAQWSVSTTTAPVNLPTPVRDRYVFKGWYVEGAAESGITGSFTPDSDVTLFAIWERIPDGILTLEDTGGRQGTEIAIPVDLSANPGVSYLRMRVVYDRSLLECLGVEDGSITGWSFNANSGILQWLSNTAMETTACGTILTLRFQILDTAEDGDTAVSLSVLEAYNRAEEDVVIADGSATVAISSRLPGDVNGDEKVDLLDLVRLLKYQAEEPVEINASNADVTGDGAVNGKDLIRMRLYLAGVPGTILN